MASSLARRGRRGLVLGPLNSTTQTGPQIHHPPSSPSSPALLPHHHNPLHLHSHPNHQPLHSNEARPSQPSSSIGYTVSTFETLASGGSQQFATSVAPVSIDLPRKHKYAPASVETPPIPDFAPHHPPSPSATKSYFPPYHSYVASQQSQLQSHLARPKTPTSPLSPCGSIPRSPRIALSPIALHPPQSKMIQSAERPPSPFTMNSAMSGPESVMAPGFAPSTRSKSSLKLSSLPGTSMRGFQPTSLQQQQMAMQMQQQQLIYQATRTAAGLGGPASPRLAPLGSPGPVTPMMLEDPQGGYLFAGTQPVLQFQQHHLDKLRAAATLPELEEENQPTNL